LLLLSIFGNSVYFVYDIACAVVIHCAWCMLYGVNCYLSCGWCSCILKSAAALAQLLNFVFVVVRVFI